MSTANALLTGYKGLSTPMLTQASPPPTPSVLLIWVLLSNRHISGLHASRLLPKAPFLTRRHFLWQRLRHFQPVLWHLVCDRPTAVQKTAPPPTREWSGPTHKQYWDENPCPGISVWTFLVNFNSLVKSQLLCYPPPPCRPLTGPFNAMLPCHTPSISACHTFISDILIFYCLSLLL